MGAPAEISPEVIPVGEDWVGVVQMRGAEEPNPLLFWVSRTVWRSDPFMAGVPWESGAAVLVGLFRPHGG